MEGVSKKVAIVKSDTLLHSTKSRVIKFNTMKSRKSLAFQDRGLFEAMQERIKQKVCMKLTNRAFSIQNSFRYFGKNGM